MLALLLSAALAAAPVPGADPLLDQLDLFAAPAGSYVTYRVVGDQMPLQLRLTLMRPVKDGGAPARWVLLTAQISGEDVEMWALARKRPSGLMRREQLRLKYRDQVIQAPAADDEPPDDLGPAKFKLERKGKKSIVVPAGTFLAEELVATGEDGLELHLWRSPKVPMGGSKDGGMVAMQPKGGLRWELVGFGKEPVRDVPAVTAAAGEAAAPAAPAPPASGK